MKLCRQCGEEIINGINGCMLMGDICTSCGGTPKYYAEPTRGVPLCSSYEEMDSLEGRCIYDGE